MTEEIFNDSLFWLELLIDNPLYLEDINEIRINFWILYRHTKIIKFYEWYNILLVSEHYHNINNFIANQI